MDIETKIQQITLYKVIHLKQCISYRNILKYYIHKLTLPEIYLERCILNFIGMNKFISE
jgi:hypothetical protein